MKKLIFTNLILLIIGFFILDFIFDFLDYQNGVNTIKKFAKQQNPNESVTVFPKYVYTIKMEHWGKVWLRFRNDFNSPRRITEGTSAKKSIIVFGCSFAEGALLNDNETFEYKLSKKTGRTVYNRGFGRFGLGQMVYQTKQDLFYKDITKEPEYAIYIYMPDHINRIYTSKNGDLHNYLSYENIDGELVETHPLFTQLRRFAIIKRFFIIDDHLCLEYKDDQFDLVKLHFEEAYKELKKRYPNIKFIILKHPSTKTELNEPLKNYIYTTNRWKELQDKGFIIIDLLNFDNVNFMDNKYIFPDGHPRAAAWDVVVDKITKDLDL